jgi:hypothetical protein
MSLHRALQYDEHVDWDMSACAKVAEGGHLDVLKWLREEGFRWNWYSCACAARGGHVEVLEWLGGERVPMR